MGLVLDAFRNKKDGPSAVSTIVNYLSLWRATCSNISSEVRGMAPLWTEIHLTNQKRVKYTGNTLFKQLWVTELNRAANVLKKTIVSLCCNSSLPSQLGTVSARSSTSWDGCSLI